LLHATKVSAPQVPEYNAICVLVSVPSVVRIFNCPEAGQTTEYQTVFMFPPVQQAGTAGSLALPEQLLSPVKLVLSGREEALHGKSFDGPEP
jgi:hypothetical protein